MAKAVKGDLIRITNVPRDWAYPNGGIYEVIERFKKEDAENYDMDGVKFVTPDMDESTVNYYAYDDQYEIFRKAGEEEDVASCSTCGAEVIGRKHISDSLLPIECERSITDAQLTQANRIRAACSELAELLVRKNHDYGDSFAKQYEKYGLMSALIRMDDKMRRLETLQGAENQAQVGESIGETLIDLSGYALLSYVEQSKTK